MLSRRVDAVPELSSVQCRHSSSGTYPSPLGSPLLRVCYLLKGVLELDGLRRRRCTDDLLASSKLLHLGEAEGVTRDAADRVRLGCAVHQILLLRLHGGAGRPKRVSGVEGRLRGLELLAHDSRGYPSVARGSERQPRLHEVASRLARLEAELVDGVLEVRRETGLRVLEQRLHQVELGSC